MKKKRGLKLIILLSVFIFGIVFFNKYTSLNVYRDEIKSLKEQISAQKEYSKELEETKKKYTSDEYIEENARDLGFVKPNEKIFRNYNDKK
jgi:cell division protein FtsB